MNQITTHFNTDLTKSTAHTPYQISHLQHIDTPQTCSWCSDTFFQMFQSADRLQISTVKRLLQHQHQNKTKVVQLPSDSLQLIMQLTNLAGNTPEI